MINHIKLKRSHCYDEIKAILETPGIWECIADPGDELPPELDTENEIYIVGYFAGEPIGVFIIDEDGETCHFQVIPKHRKLWAVIFAKKCLQWCVDNGFNKLRALIPDDYPNVKDFGLKVGFEMTKSDNCWSAKWEKSEK